MVLETHAHRGHRSARCVAGHPLRASALPMQVRGSGHRTAQTVESRSQLQEFRAAYKAWRVAIDEHEARFEAMLRDGTCDLADAMGELAEMDRLHKILVETARFILTPSPS